MSVLEDICEVFFDGKVKPKHLTTFTETTPQGNKISGVISRKPNKYLGSLLITNVNGEITNQFIQSMPKIHYYNDSRDISKDITNYCYEKLDGSCLILYPLKNNNGEIIEIVPKTRGRAVADSHFVDLYNKIDKKPIQDYYENNDGILIFEMYGILNQHDIIHYNTGIDIRLISIVENGVFDNSPYILEKGEYGKCMQYGFQLPDILFELYYKDREWYIQSTSKKYYPYLKNTWENYPTIDDAIDGLMDIMEQLNKDYYKINGRIAIEGVVINTVREDDSKKFLKCKPRDIMIKHKSENGIPRKSITKEVLKYFDEYGSEVKKIYNENPNHHTEYLHRMLLEEYSEEIILKSKNKIERIFMQIWENKEIPQSIHNICDEIYNKYNSKGIKHCMRMFAQNYPMKKKDSRLVYSVLEKKFLNEGKEL